MSLPPRDIGTKYLQDIETTPLLDIEAEPLQGTEAKTLRDIERPPLPDIQVRQPGPSTALPSPANLAELLWSRRPLFRTVGPRPWTWYLARSWNPDLRAQERFDPGPTSVHLAESLMPRFPP